MHETNERQSSQSIPAKIGLAFAGLGILMLVIGFFLYRHTSDWLDRSETCEGTVIELKAESSQAGGSSATLYRPIFEFQTADGKNIRLESSVKSSSPGVEVGETVAICYDPLRPERGCRDSFVSIWLGVVIMVCIGVVFLVLGSAVALAFHVSHFNNARSKLS